MTDHLLRKSLSVSDTPALHLRAAGGKITSILRASDQAAEDPITHAREAEERTAFAGVTENSRGGDRRKACAISSSVHTT